MLEPADDLAAGGRCSFPQRLLGACNPLAVRARRRRGQAPGGGEADVEADDQAHSPPLLQAGQERLVGGLFGSDRRGGGGKSFRWRLSGGQKENKGNQKDQAGISVAHARLTVR